MRTVAKSDYSSPSQSAALHALFRQYAPRFLGAARIERRERLAWASGVVGRQLESFSELRCKESARLIDLMKRSLGQEVTPAMPRSSSWRRPDRDQAHAYGTAGRRDQASNEVRLVDVPTLELVDRLRAQLGWTEARLKAFLNCSNSPVPGGVIRTLPQANGVIWALRNMLRRTERANTKEQAVGTTHFSRSNQGTLDFGRIEEGRK
jgi:hypothetical protein